MTDPLVRQDVWLLEQQQAWHPVIEAYALAVGVMTARPGTDPTSWSYQAAVHGTGDNADQWRNQCQHNSWFFLPWHRMYLYWFERIVRSVIQTLSQVDDVTKQTWALPFWNYDNGGSTASLPPSFRETTMPNGDANPLYVELRDPNINQGGLIPAEATSPAFALRERRFTDPSAVGGTVGFGGPQTAWHHFGEDGTSTPGALEATPHNAVHGIVGGPGGLMSDFDTAPLDPIFWLHHANIDRLWTVWLGRSGRANPTDAAWTTPPLFHFHDEQGSDVTNVPSDVLDPVGQLGYTYTPVAAPAPGGGGAPAPVPGGDGAPTPVPGGGGAPAPVPSGVGAQPRVEASAAEPPGSPAPDHPAELVGASDSPLELTGQETTLRVGLSRPAGPLSARAAQAPLRVYLNVEDIRAPRNPGLSYAVYVNVPDDADQPTRAGYHVGNVSFFGVELASDPGRDRTGGHGALRYVFDITDLATRLRAEGRWDDTQLSVSFSPLRALPPPGADAGRQPADAGPAGGAAAPVTVGRVSVFYR